jgi:hypothetical protein
MFIQVIHDITDKSDWTKRLADFEKQGPPTDMMLHSSGTSNDGTKAFCLWEAPSVRVLSSFLDQAVAGAAKNTYYALDEKAPATRLPTRLIAR